MDAILLFHYNCLLIQLTLPFYFIMVICNINTPADSRPALIRASWNDAGVTEGILNVKPAQPATARAHKAKERIEPVEARVKAEEMSQYAFQAYRHRLMPLPAFR